MAIITVDCVTINSVDPLALAAFWAALVGGAPQDGGNGFVIVRPEGRIPLLFQKADAPGTDPGWIHLDCTASDRDAAVPEICRLGGSLVEQRSDSHGSWTVMSDPEGNLFCI